MYGRLVVREKPEFRAVPDTVGCPDAVVQDTVDFGDQVNPLLGMRRPDPASEIEIEQPVVERGVPSACRVVDGGRRWLNDCAVGLDRRGITKERYDRSGHRQNPLMYQNTIEINSDERTVLPENDNAAPLHIFKPPRLQSAASCALTISF